MRLIHWRNPTMKRSEMWLFEDLLATLRFIRDEIHATREDQRAADTNRDAQPIRPIPVELGANSHIPAAISEHYEAENRYRNSKWRKVKTGAEILGIASAFALAILTFVTLCEIKKQTLLVQKSADAAKSAADTAHDALVRSQRPWLGINGPMIAVERLRIESIQERMQIHGRVKIAVRNFGVSPALHVGIEITDVPYERSTEEDVEIHSRTFKETADRSCRIADIKASSLDGHASGPFIFPNIGGDVESLLNTNSPPRVVNSWITVVGCISYGDQFDPGHSHHTRFCFMSKGVMTNISAGEVFVPCSENQEVD
jgi:hypothetical protein